MSLDEVRQATLAALHQGRPDLARQLSLGVIQYDDTDPLAHFTLAVAQRQLGELDAARTTSRKAFKLAQSDLQSYAAARLSAGIAAQDGRFLHSQVWLRRAAHLAPEDAQRDAVVRQFTQVRAVAPWALSFSASMAPSSNLNNGASSAFYIIDGVPAVGILSAEAQALSGIEMTATAQASYRLSAASDRETRLRFQGYTRQVSLSSDARALAPAAQDSDYALFSFESGVTHKRRIGDGDLASFGLTLGHTRYGGAALYDFGRLDGSYTHRLPSGTTLGGALSLELRDRPSGTQDQATVASLTAGRKIAQRDQLTARLSFGRNDPNGVIYDNTSVSGQLSYSLGQEVAGMGLSAALGVGRTHYPDYTVPLFTVPGGREDLSYSASVTMQFQNLDYAGFVPTMTVEAKRTTSNVSLYDTREMSVSFGIKSAF